MDLDFTTLALGAVLCVIVTFLVDLAVLWLLYYLMDPNKKQ